MVIGMSEPVVMTCMTTKKKFDSMNPPVVVLGNGRYAYRAPCPWRGKNDKELFAYKFCSAAAYQSYTSSTDDKQVPSEDEQ